MGDLATWFKDSSSEFLTQTHYGMWMETTNLFAGSLSWIVELTCFFLRLCVYFTCSTNNCAHTVRDHFLSATVDFSWSSRVRSDHGMKNVEVACLMISC